MKRFLAFIFCVLALSVSAQDTQIRKGGGGAGGSATNAVATIRKDGTPIVNGATAIDFTNAAGSVVTVTADGTTARVGIPQGGGGSVDPTNAVLANIISTLAATNKLNQWLIYSGVGSATNSYFAENAAINYFTNSVDFAGLLQSIANRAQNGFSIKIAPVPYYTNAYVFSNTVIFTNWGTVYGESAGNPTIAFRAAPSFSGSLIQLGTTTIGIGGISGWRDIRFEGDQAATNGVGVEIVNVAEPLFDFCEFTGFKLAGIHVNTTNSTFWGHAARSWFVQKWNSSHGILFSKTPIDTYVPENHFNIWNCTFGMFGSTTAQGITVSNYFPGITIQQNRFTAEFGGATHGIGAFANGIVSIQGNNFDEFSSAFPIYLYDRGSATNYTLDVSLNTTDEDGPILIVGNNVQGVTAFGNRAKNEDTVLYVGNNGNPTLLEKDRLQINSVVTTGPITNNSTSGGGIYTSDANGFFTYSSATDYMLFSQPQGGIFSTLDNWILGQGLSGATILSLSTNTSSFNSNLWVKGTNLVRQMTFTGGQPSNSFLYLNAQSNVAAGTFGAGFSFSGGTLTTAGGAGGSTTQTNSGPYITETNKNFVDSLTVGWSGTNTSGDLSLSPYVKNNSIASAQIQNSGVDTVDINNNAVDGTKIAMGSDAAGDMLYYNGTDYVRLPRVATGRILQDNGSAPSWVSFDFKNAAASLTLTSVIEVRTTNNLELISGGTVGNGTRALLGLATNPALTGDPTAPTPTAGDNDTSIATTAFVTAGKSNMVTAEIGRLNITNGISMTGPSGTAAEIQLFATNNTPVVLGVANSNSFPVTNLFGVLHKASASVIVLDCNHGNKFQITNQLGQATSLIVTNLAQGQEITISGDADGTSRVVTVIPHLGYLVRDFDTFGVSAAANKAITATNGNTFEINIAAKWSFGTNFADIVTRQAKY